MKTYYENEKDLIEKTGNNFRKLVEEAKVNSKYIEAENNFDYNNLENVEVVLTDEENKRIKNLNMIDVYESNLKLLEEEYKGKITEEEYKKAYNIFTTNLLSHKNFLENLGE